MKKSLTGTRNYGLIHDGWLMVLCEYIDGFKNLDFAEQYHLADLIMKDGQSHYKHLYYHDGFSIPYQEIYKRFGPARFQELNNVFGFFEVSSWDHSNHYTRCYRLTEKSQQAKEAYYKLLKDSDYSGKLLFHDGRVVKSLRQAIASKDSAGNTAKNKNSDGVINPLVKVNTKYLKRMIACLEGLVNETTK